MIKRTSMIRWWRVLMMIGSVVGGVCCHVTPVRAQTACPSDITLVSCDPCAATPTPHPAPQCPTTPVCCGDCRHVTWWESQHIWYCYECQDTEDALCYSERDPGWAVCCQNCANAFKTGQECCDEPSRVCLVPEELRGTEEEWACCPPGTNADCTNVGFNPPGPNRRSGWECDLFPTPTPTVTPTPEWTPTPEPTATPADAYTVHVVPSTGCTVYARDGGIDAVETPNGIVCAGGMTTTNPLCTEQFTTFHLTMLKVVTDPGYEFTGWTVNGAPAKQTTGPLFLTTRPGAASRSDLLPPGIAEVNAEVGCSIQPTVDIVSADVTHNQIQVLLEPAGATGTLTLELRNPDTYVIVHAQPRTGSADIQNETFGLDAWNDAAIGQYTRLRAIWTIGTISVQDEFVFPEGQRLNVLGMYNHTRYNTPTEDFCDGANMTLQYTEGDCQNIQQCIWNTGSGISGWLSEIEENGSGYSTALGYVSLEWFCQNPNATYRLRRVSGPCPQCGGNLTVNVSVARNPDNVDLPCGAMVYVHTVGVVTVQDAGGRVAMQQLDHYVGAGGCNRNAGTIGQRMTIRLY